MLEMQHSFNLLDIKDKSENHMSLRAAVAACVLLHAELVLSQTQAIGTAGPPIHSARSASRTAACRSVIGSHLARLTGCSARLLAGSSVRLLPDIAVCCSLCDVVNKKYGTRTVNAKRQTCEEAT